MGAEVDPKFTLNSTMNPISVKPCRPVVSHDSIKATIEFANTHPLQSQAKKDTELLIGSELKESFWSTTEFVLQYSNKLNLHIYLQDDQVCWRVCEKLPLVANRQTVGSEPIVLRWPGGVGDHPMDCSDMIEKRIGSAFKMLFVNDMGLWVYTKNSLILAFSIVERTDNGKRILYVWERE